MAVSDSSELPTDVKIIISILKMLSDGNGRPIDDIYQKIMEEGLVPDTSNAGLKKKDTESWKLMQDALSRLKKRHLIKTAGRNRRELTESGLKLVDSGLDLQHFFRSSAIDSDCTFFEHLINKGLHYDIETVENFLLSLKTKQFIILSGGAGTGKTQLVKAYGEFISHSKPKNPEFEVTIGKSADSEGYTLDQAVFFENLPPSANKYSGSYIFNIGGVEARSNVSLSPRLFFDSEDPNVEDVKKILEKYGKYSDKVKLTLHIPIDRGQKKYLIVPVGSNWTDNRQILGYRNAITEKYVHTSPLDFILRADTFETHPYLLILDEMNLSHVERYFSDLELDSLIS